MVLEILSPLVEALNPYLDIIYPNFMSALPALALIMLSIAAYATLIYIFYRLVAKRDIFEWNVEKYRIKKGGMFAAIVDLVLGIIKYGIFFPFVVFLWFGGFSVLLSLLAKNINMTHLLLISATLVAAIRLTSYYTEDLSKDLAKLVPFALLGIALAEPTFFSLELFAQRLADMPQFLPQIAAYLTFIILLEWVLRVVLAFKHLVFGVARPKAEGNGA
ncbi:MAG: hypothetical protein V1676_04145 [Candidatus Diapherotrites archaeon]